MRVEDVMTRDVITVRPETTIHEAAALMVVHGVSGLPVVDDARHVVGILSEGDLILRQKGRSPTRSGAASSTTARSWPRSIASTLESLWPT
jgi:CBS domain-containing protein